MTAESKGPSDAVHDLSLVDAAAAIRKGEVSSQDLTRTALDRLESNHPALNCVMTLDRDGAMETAAALDAERAAGKFRGPLHGVPLAHKDLFYRKGRRSTFGSPILDTHVATSTATVLERFDAAGAVDVGTLHLSEFAFSPTGFNRSYGHARNPWNPDYIPGGSSSGSAIAVAGRLVYGALGTDTGGSLRHPAAACGATGLKTTLTRVSRAGVGPLSFSLDCVGPLARTARDCARLLGVIGGYDERDPTSSRVAVPDYEAGLSGQITGLRVAAPRAYYHECLDGEVSAILEDSLAVLRAGGAEVVETPVPDIGLINTMGQAVMAIEAATVHRRWLATRRDDYADVVRSRIEPGLFLTSARYVEALSLRARIVKGYIDTVFAGADLVFLPAIPIPLPTIAETTTDDPAVVGKRLGQITHCTRGINYLGLPAISVPAGFTSNGLPCAFQLVGRPFAEALLLTAADAYQRETDWHQRSPGL